MTKINETGNRYGRLTVVSYSHTNRFGLQFWLCVCDCGKEKIVSGGRLRSNLTKSCGCLRIEKAIERILKFKGVSQSKETIEKRANKMRGRKRPPFSEEWREKIGEAAKGRTMTPENRIKLSERCKGEQCHFWKGGVTPINNKIRQSLEYKEWRKAVFNRDDWTCQNCGRRGGNMEAHHIKDFSIYSELRFELSNGLTLCKPCHDKTKHNRQNRRILPNGKVV